MDFFTRSSDGRGSDLGNTPLRVSLQNLELNSEDLTPELVGDRDAKVESMDHSALDLSFDRVLAPLFRALPRSRQESRRPREKPALSHHPTDRLWRARRLFARWQAHRLHGKELRRRV